MRWCRWECLWTFFLYEHIRHLWVCSDQWAYMKCACRCVCGGVRAVYGFQFIVVRILCSWVIIQSLYVLLVRSLLPFHFIYAIVFITYMSQVTYSNLTNSEEFCCRLWWIAMQWAAEWSCSVCRMFVLCLQHVHALSAECSCSVRISVYYLLPTHKAIDLQSC